MTTSTSIVVFAGSVATTEQSLTEYEQLELELKVATTELEQLQSQLDGMNHHYEITFPEYIDEINSLMEEIAERENALIEGKKFKKKKKEKSLAERIMEGDEDAIEEVKARNREVENERFGRSKASKDVVRLYREISTRIHPDKNGGVFQSSAMEELWIQACEAYKRNDLSWMQTIHDAVMLKTGLLSALFRRCDAIRDSIKGVRNTIKVLKSQPSGQMLDLYLNEETREKADEMFMSNVTTVIDKLKARVKILKKKAGEESHPLGVGVAQFMDKFFG